MPDWRVENAGARASQPCSASATDYLKAWSAETLRREHRARSSRDPGANPFHYVVVHVDGKAVSLEVISVDWGRGFNP